MKITLNSNVTLLGAFGPYAPQVFYNDFGDVPKDINGVIDFDERGYPKRNLELTY